MFYFLSNVFKRWQYFFWFFQSYYSDYFFIKTIKENHRILRYNNNALFLWLKMKFFFHKFSEFRLSPLNIWFTIIVNMSQIIIILLMIIINFDVVYNFLLNVIACRTRLNRIYKIYGCGFWIVYAYECLLKKVFFFVI